MCGGERQSPGSINIGLGSPSLALKKLSRKSNGGAGAERSAAPSPVTGSSFVIESQRSGSFTQYGGYLFRVTKADSEKQNRSVRFHR